MSRCRRCWRSGRRSGRWTAASHRWVPRRRQRWSSGRACRQAARKLHEHYAILSVDSAGEGWVLADPLAIEPVYWKADGESLLVANRLGFIEAADPAGARVLEPMLWLPTVGFRLGRELPWTGARALGPGEMLRLEGGRAEAAVGDAAAAGAGRAARLACDRGCGPCDGRDRPPHGGAAPGAGPAFRAAAADPVGRRRQSDRPGPVQGGGAGRSDRRRDLRLAGPSGRDRGGDGGGPGRGGAPGRRRSARPAGRLDHRAGAGEARHALGAERGPAQPLGPAPARGRGRRPDPGRASGRRAQGQPGRPAAAGPPAHLARALPVRPRPAAAPGAAGGADGGSGRAGRGGSGRAAQQRCRGRLLPSAPGAELDRHAPAQRGGAAVAADAALRPGAAPAHLAADPAGAPAARGLRPAPPAPGT